MKMENRNEYKAPYAEVILLDGEDVIRTSDTGIETSVQESSNGNWNLNSK